MSEFIDNLIATIQAKLPDAQVCLAPTECFVARAFEKPEGIGADELYQFAEFSLEDVSPFPVDQLAWGYVQLPASHRVFIYAAYQNRLTQAGLEDLEGYYHAFPAFVSRLGGVYETPTVTMVFDNRSASLLFFEAGDPIPKNVISEYFAPPAPEPEVEEVGDDDLVLAQTKTTEAEPAPIPAPTDDEILAERERLLKQIDTTGYTVDPDTWINTRSVIGDDNRLRFYHRRAGEPPTAPAEEDGEPRYAEEETLFPFREQDAWNADIRKPEFRDKARRERAAAGKIWKAMLACGVAAMILLLVQVSTVFLDVWINKRRVRIAKQAERVALVQSQQDLLDKIQQFSAQELQPLLMLDILNRPRPRSIHFIQASSTDQRNQLAIKGEGRRLTDINNYANALEASPLITSLDLRPGTVTGGKAPFYTVGNVCPTGNPGSRPP